MDENLRDETKNRQILELNSGKLKSKTSSLSLILNFRSIIFPVHVLNLVLSNSRRDTFLNFFRSQKTENV